ncbi:MAG TPA: dihydrofolate reductase family protein [Ktedonobacterales bacterium]|nr:dihydrofolate reductase family protein [Ktedonobacterales bacterium]
MDTIRTLFESAPQSTASFPAELAALYDGGLTLETREDRPLVLVNFVSTLDGVVSYALPGRSGGGEIGGFNQADHFIMGLLRAHADAVLCGAGSMNEDVGHVRTPGFVYPEAHDLYAELRQRLGKARPEPLTVVVSASGRVNLAEANFHTPGVETLIITTDAGAELLRADPNAQAVTHIRSLGAGPRLAPEAMLRLLGDEFGLRVVLNEGGPGILTSFLKARCVHELFLTLAPQLAGRDADHPRPSLIDHHAFLPEDAPWGQLLALKQAGEHLFLRYSFTSK